MDTTLEQQLAKLRQLYRENPKHREFIKQLADKLKDRYEEYPQKVKGNNLIKDVKDSLL